MRVLLTTLNAKYIHVNLAIRLLYELNKEREGLEWKEFTIKEPQDEVADFCADFDIVAFSCYIWNITQTLAVIKKIKERDPSVKILLGGPEVSYDWQDVIAVEGVDYIITGEGEIPFHAFLESYPNVQNVPNLVSKTGKEIHFHAGSATFDLQNYSNLMPYRSDDPKTLLNKVLGSSLR